MRAIRFDDLSLALRALLAAEAEARPALAVRLLEEADLADRYRRRTGRRLGAGDGTLGAACLARALAPPVRRIGPEASAALTLLLAALEARRARAAARGGRTDGGTGAARGRAAGRAEGL
ncbi:hypothetical protein [Wenxinia saemankumensis]|uniref:DUF7742 domain-containing protein n=1 Tax=Wenxinia saemankumensis TaxID=1447782 RepID=A0A1M6GNC7_9RHOB|nr:hypothetical protein [Wenxinia saemankumensis]SHJ11403.1 hypothetical protein SAMN05444417_2823 [Wenxinia saemankumensis]